MIAGQNVQSAAGRTRAALPRVVRTGLRLAGAAIVAAALLAAPAAPLRAAHAADAAPPSGPAATGDVARGRYIAHSVAMCVQCHTPRNADGTLDETRLFQGAAIPVESPFRGQEWAFQAPAIAGLAGFNEEDELSLLTTGHRRDGKMPKPPMPPFRLSPEDARAVIAYLRSLRP